MVITILAELIQIIRPRLLKRDLLCRQISLNLAISGKNGGDYRKKIVSTGTIIHLCLLRFVLHNVHVRESTQLILQQS